MRHLNIGISFPVEVFISREHTSGHAGVAFEWSMVNQATNGCWCIWIGTGQWGLLANAEQIGDKVSIGKDGGIGESSCEDSLRIVSCNKVLR